MGKFRAFILKEHVGLGDLSPRIDQLLHSQKLNNAVGSFLGSDWMGSEQQSSGQPALPSIDLTIPQMERTARITHLMLKRNPIYLRLSDGTEAYLTLDEYKRIQGQPAVGKLMTVILQRHPNDSSGTASKIERAIVRE